MVLSPVLQMHSELKLNMKDDDQNSRELHFTSSVSSRRDVCREVRVADMAKGMHSVWQGWELYIWRGAGMDPQMYNSYSPIAPPPL
jgi:hypothetical protein